LIARFVVVLAALFSWAGATYGQTISTGLPSQRVSLSATASVQVNKDWLTVSLTTTREGADPQTVQGQLKVALDAALALAKSDARAGQMEVRTGRFGLVPRYAREGKLTGWQGTAELILEGQDIARISATAGKLQTLTVANMSFGLTPVQRQAAQATAQSQAISLFRQRASDIAKSFDLTGYTLGEVTVNFDDGGYAPRPMMMAARAMSADAAVPVEAGLALVSVTVSGSVQLK